MDTTQQQHADPEAIVAAMADGEEKVKALIELYRSYASDDIGKAVRFAREAYALATSLGSRKWTARALLMLGGAGVDQGTYDTALSHLLRARELFAGMGDRLGECSVLINIGSLYQELGALSDGMDYMFQALKNAEELEVLQLQAVCHANLSGIFQLLQHFDQAMEHSAKARELSTHLGDIYGCIHAELATGNCWGTLRQEHGKALEHFQKGLAIAREHGGFKGLEAHLLSVIGSAYGYLEDHAEASRYLARSWVLQKEFGGKRDQAACLLMMGKNELALNNIERAGEHLFASLAISEAVGNREQLYSIHEVISLYYRRKEDYTKALEHYEQFHRIKEEVFNEQGQQRVAAMMARYDVDKAQIARELAEREREIVRAKNEELSSALQEVQALNTRLTELNREKNEMLGIVAHDLKSPLAGMRMVATLLREHARNIPKEELIRNLADMERTSERMLGAVSALLDVQAIESGAVFGTADSIDVGVLIGSIVRSYTAEAQRKGIAVSVECPDGCMVRCSREALQQAVDNLVSNALKFSPGGTHVWVRLRRCDANIEIEIEDEGPGIRPEEREQMFGKYIRLSSRPTGGESSTGLGLWIVHKAVEAIQGRITCRSGERGGTVFLVEIAASTPTGSAHA